MRRGCLEEGPKHPSLSKYFPFGSHLPTDDELEYEETRRFQRVLRWAVLGSNQ
jgi:hypothetical protein